MLEPTNREEMSDTSEFVRVIAKFVAFKGSRVISCRVFADKNLMFFKETSAHLHPGCGGQN